MIKETFEIIYRREKTMTRKKYRSSKKLLKSEGTIQDEVYDSVMSLSLKNSAQYQFLFDSFKLALLHADSIDDQLDPFYEMRDVFKSTHFTGLRFDEAANESLQNRLSRLYAQFRGSYSICRCGERAEFVSFSRKSCHCKMHAHDRDDPIERMVFVPCSLCSADFAVTVCLTCASAKPLLDSVFCAACSEQRAHKDTTQIHLELFFEDLLSSDELIKVQTQRLKTKSLDYLSKLNSYLDGPVAMMISTEKELILEAYAKLKRIFMIFFNLRSAVFGVLNKEIGPEYHTHLCDEVEKCLSMKAPWTEDSVFAKGLDYKKHLVQDSNFVPDHFWHDFSTRIKAFEIDYLNSISFPLKAILDYNEVAFFAENLKSVIGTLIDSMKIEENDIMINLIAAETISTISSKPNLIGSIPSAYSAILFD